MKIMDVLTTGKPFRRASWPDGKFAQFFYQDANQPLLVLFAGTDVRAIDVPVVDLLATDWDFVAEAPAPVVETVTGSPVTDHDHEEL